MVVKRSGGMNDGVPSAFDDFDTDASINLAIPKSETRVSPSSSSNIFAGFRSR